MEPFIEQILISEEEIQAKVKELGEKINKDYHGEELRVVGILRGAFIFMADLVRNIKLPLSCLLYTSQPSEVAAVITAAFPFKSKFTFIICYHLF